MSRASCVVKYPYPMKTVIAGGTGFLGRALAADLLAAGHDVIVLTRGPAPEHSTPAGPRLVAWAPGGPPGPWRNACAGADAIVNLAGESIAARRWTEHQKDRLWASREAPTGGLVGLIAAMSPPPSVFVSASAIGYYGSCGDGELTEDDPAGSDFLADLARRWEELALRATSPSTRVAVVRTGIVLDPREGALARMLPPFRMGVGGRFGSGRQYMSWIHRDDWVRLVRWIIESAAVSGPVNATAPGPVTNAEFVRTLGTALRRPALVPAPAFALRLALGEMADPLLLFSQRVRPARALKGGFRFSYDHLAPALAHLLAR